MSIDDAVPTVADLRAEIARQMIPKYVIAGLARVHPETLGKMLQERKPMPPATVLRIVAALKAHVKSNEMHEVRESSGVAL